MIILKKVTKADSDLIFQVATQKTVRQVSFNQNHISRKDHEKWFKKMIDSKSILFLAIFDNKNFSGYIRYKILKNTATISLALLEEQQGKGIGKNSLALSMSILKKEYPQIFEIEALVLNDNLKSRSFFLNNGFTFVENLKIDKKVAGRFLYEI